MKRAFIIVSLFLFLLGNLSGQTHGITYQAVIVDPDPQEIPGVDITGNYLPNHNLSIRFTLQDENAMILYQEVQNTITDKYGMINLTIGLGTVTVQSPVIFTEIDWNGTSVNLIVEIALDISGQNFVELSYQPLYFVPYAFHRNITATGTSDLNGQVTINAGLSGDDSNYDAYSLRVEGSNQGVGIRLDGSRTSANNFVTFWDDAGIQGRIEGQITSDVYNDPEYIFDHAMFAAKTAVQVANIAIAAAASILDPGNVGIEAANSALLVAEIAEYEIFAFSNLGVAYESGAGDYAEWLPRLYPDEEIEYGQIVGLYNGKITKTTEGADMLMVVSKAPIVLGNMPPDSIGQGMCEKVAFMGQVPVRVMGKVNKGDYIIGYKSGSGYGKAVSPSELTIDMMNSVVGRSWTEALNQGINLVQIVVGVKTNEWVGFLKSNAWEIDSLRREVALLKNQIKKSESILTKLVPGYAEEMNTRSQENLNTPELVTALGTKYTKTVMPTTEATQIMTREIILENFDKTAHFLHEQGVDISKNNFYSRLYSDPEYKELVIKTVLSFYNSGQ